MFDDLGYQFKGIGHLNGQATFSFNRGIKIHIYIIIHTLYMYVMTYNLYTL